MATDVPRDLALDIPLQGVQLIEASAGTGKTFTVATLYARLVIEAGFEVTRLLAVTYTVAATKELREQLRQRLVLARDRLDVRLGVAADDAGGDPAAPAMDALLARVLAREAPAALRGRILRAVQAMDLAPIHTIHGFCQRALHEHALQAGQPLDARELVMNEAALLHEVALEFWRRHSQDADEARALLEVWASPAALARGLRDLMAFDRLEPEPGPPDAAAAAALEQARQSLAAVFLRDGDAARELLRQAAVNRQVHATVSRDDAVDKAWAALRAWAPAPGGRDPATDTLARYGSDALAAKALKGKTAPASPVFEAIAAWTNAKQAVDAELGRAKLVLVHAARHEAIARLAQLKAERGLIGFDDMIRELHAAVMAPQGGAFVAALQAQYAVALVDEFQDTDARQWEIFRRLFAVPADEARDEARALFLIGDPKQAIYGFRGGDVATYLVAQGQASARHSLERNFRSRPRALAAVAALFDFAGPDAFRTAGIGFEAVSPGPACRDEFFQVAGDAMPGLLVQALASDGETSMDEARAEATDACVAAIHQLLVRGRAGLAQVAGRDGVLRGVRPADISVLVPRHEDGLGVQRALSRLGIPSVAVGRVSIFQSEEARHLCWLLEALIAPADDARLRAALATPLFGLGGAEIAAFDVDLAAHRGWQDRLQHWAQRARRHGPMAALGEICAAQAPRLLTWPDGERRLSNYLQLAEELQAADAVALGLVGLLAELERRIEDADSGNDEELLRLDSDAERVRIMTVHVSKGLTLDLVFVPFTATTRADQAPPRALRLAAYRDPALQRVARLYPEATDAACALERAEREAEHVRLLYVALTRARLATWVSWGPVKGAGASALGLLLDRRDVQALVEAADGAIKLLPAIAPDAVTRLARLAPADTAARPAPPAPSRVLDRDWWVYSFSQLAREASGIEVRGADDEVEAPLLRSRFSGSRFGNVLHEALENVDFAAWRDFRGELPPTGQLEPLQVALRRAGFGGEADQVDGVRLLCALVGETLNAPMPEGTRLALLPAHERLAEMEFHLALAPVQVEAMLDLLHAHGLVAARRGFGARRRLEGLLTGRIDLIYAQAGRFYVLDYKSNQLPDYDAAAVSRAIAEGEYDLQYLIYTLALHRWLRFRLREAYDPELHLGGVRYLFCRGLDRDDPARPGVHALRLPTALVLELDALLAAESNP